MWGSDGGRVLDAFQPRLQPWSRDPVPRYMLDMLSLLFRLPWG
jgi:hypothetical protein